MPLGRNNLASKVARVLRVTGSGGLGLAALIIMCHVSALLSNIGEVWSLAGGMCSGERGFGLCMSDAIWE
jgi:hypothetical protein